jgi:CHAT domain-containing protein
VNTLPHVTWCTTGPLAFLPLHAAGSYGASAQSSHAKAYNYFVSSYSPSISALIKSEDTDSYAFNGITAVSLRSTADKSLGLLPGTVQEVENIKNHFDANNFTWLNEEKSTRMSVLGKMRESSWLHLACHGVQRRDNPMDSAFILHDGALTLRTTSQENLPNARLAFLSACQTATGDEKLASEAAHLAAGMLMIGYHSVVGTMWSIRDQDAPNVAEEFYKYLVAGGMKTDKGQAAYALHKAIGQLRDTVGMDKFAWWVPFVHLGI